MKKKNNAKDKNNTNIEFQNLFLVEIIINIQERPKNKIMPK